MQLKKLAATLFFALVAVCVASAPLTLAVSSCSRAPQADAGDLVLGSNDAAATLVFEQDPGSTGYQLVPNLPPHDLIQLSHPTHKLGVTIQEAGVDAGSVDDAGYLTFTLATPMTAPMGDPPITGAEIRGVYLDLVGGTYSVKFVTIGGNPARDRWVTGQISAAYEQTFVAAVKAQIASTYGVTFQ